MRDVKEFINKIRYPDEEYSAIPFWFLNDKPDEAKLRADIISFKNQGLDAVILHPRIGLPKDMAYLSDEFFDMIGIAIDQAKKSGVKVILYDEGMYPSGSAGGIICRDYPHLKSKGLFLVEKTEECDEVVSKIEGGYLVYRETQGRLRGLHYGEDDGDENQPYSADILNPETVTRFLEYTHERYYKRFKDYFGETVIGFFTDEPNPVGRGTFKAFPWYDGLKDELINLGGKVEELQGLFNDSNNKTVKTYRRLINARLGKVYYEKIKEWCESHGVALMGHPAHGDDVSVLKRFTVPGQDLIARFVSPEIGDAEGVESVLGKVPADFAELTGVRRNVNEAMGCCGRSQDPWLLPPSDMKWYIDYLAVRGVNMFVLHAFYYSLRGERKNERPPDVGYNNEWWSDYKYFSNYIKRLSYIMTGIKSLSNTAISCDDGDVPVEEAKQLFENQIQFTYVPVFMKEAFEKFKHVYKRGDSIDTETLKKERKVFFSEYEPNIRLKSFLKEGIECCFAVNAGETAIKTQMIFRTDKNILAVDLWSGEYYSIGKIIGNGVKSVDCELSKRESILFVLYDGEFDTKPKPELKFADVKFRLENKGDNRATYIGELRINEKNKNIAVKVAAEETVEWFVNGNKIGCTFWNEHVLRLGDYLKIGENEIKLTVRGSTANLYGKKSYPYGILK